ncbi:MAG: hypothetical protein AB7F59_14580 [Bdellovibrionales bacterium]
MLASWFSFILFLGISVFNMNASAQSPLKEAVNNCTQSYRSAAKLRCEDLVEQLDTYRDITNLNESGRACSRNTRIFASILDRSFKCKSLGKGLTSCTAQCAKANRKIQSPAVQNSSVYPQDLLERLSQKMVENSRYCSRMVALVEAQKVSAVTPPSCDVNVVAVRAERLDPRPRSSASDFPRTVVPPPAAPPVREEEETVVSKDIPDDGFVPISK